MALPKVGVQLALEGASDFFADLNKAQQEMAALGKANISGAAFGDLAKGANDAAGSIDKLGRGAHDAGGGFSALKEVGIGALREIGAVAVNVGAELGVMAAGFLADSVAAAGDFEASVNNLAAVSGTALAEAGFSFDDVSEKALQLGADTRFSASESIAAMTELVKGGVPVAQVMDQATQATLDLAAAAGVDLSNAAEIVAKQFGVWSDTGISTTQISDLLTQAANASTVGVEDLALGLANVGGVAKVSGLDFQELTQTMALIAPGFSSAADAGTSLKTFLTSLQPASAPAREAMDQLGLISFNTTKAMEVLRGMGIEPLGADAQVLGGQIERMGQTLGWTKTETETFLASLNTSAFYDQQGAFVGMEEAARLLQGSLAGLSEAEQTAALKAIFGQDAFRAAALIAEAGAPGFVAMGESMAAAGTAAETAAIQNQGWNFALDQFKAGIETLQITLGTLFLPMLTSVAGAFSGVVEQVTTVVKALSGNQEAFAQLSPTLQRIVTIVQSVSGALADAGPFSLEFAESLSLIHPALQPLMNGLSQAVGFIQANFIPVMATVAGALLGALVPGIAAAIAAAGGIGGVFAAAGAAVAGAGAAFLTIAAPIAAVAALAAALATAWQSNLGGIQDATAAAMAAIGGALQAGAAVVQVVLNQISAFWAANGAEITAFAQQAWGQLSTIIGEVAAIVMTIVSGLATTLSGIFQGIASFIAAHGDTIQSVLSSAWQVVSGIVSGALNIIQGVVRTVLGVIRGDWDGAWKGVQQVAQGAMGILRTIFSSGLDLIKGLFTLAVAGIRTILSGFVSQAMTLGRDIIDGIIAGVKGGVTALGDAVRNAAQSALDSAKRALGISSPSRLFADEVGQPIVAGTAKGILDNIEILLNAASKMGAIVLQEAKAFAKTVQDALGPLLAQAYKGAADYARSKAGALADLGSLFNVDSSEYDRLKEAAGEASREAARLFFGDDKDAAAGAQAIYSQLAAQRNAARAVMEQQRAIAKEAQQQILAAQKAVAGITDPAERAAAFNVQKSAILETAKLRQQIVGATDQEERQRLEEQLRLIQEAQKAEFALYESEAKERQRQRDQQLREAKEALKQLGNLVFYSQEDVFGKGEDLIKGLIQGAVSQTDALKDALAKMLNDALAAMKKQMGIRSPSKVFALELGAPIGQGVISGAERALGGLGATLAADLRGAAGIAAQTIRPPARAGQLAGSMSSSTTYAPVYNYSPQYQGAPRQPMQDFAIMRSLYGRGG